VEHLYLGLSTRADYSEIYGLEIINFPDNGIEISLADYVIIGAADQGNVLYNNACGINLKQNSDLCTLSNNILGTDYGQRDVLGNDHCGIAIRDGGTRHFIFENIIAHHPIGIQIL